MFQNATESKTNPKDERQDGRQNAVLQKRTPVLQKRLRQAVFFHFAPQ